MSRKYILFFSHRPQLEWYGLIAKELRTRLGIPVILWVMGERDRFFAEATNNFDAVIDLLAGIDPKRAKEEYFSNLMYLTDFENECGKTFYREDSAIDRSVAARGWSDERIAQYAAYLLQQMKEQLATLGGLPWAAVGEANSLPYRLAHHLLGPAVPYWNFTLVRHWPHRFYLDEDQSEQWEKCRQLYLKYVEKGVPQRLYSLAKDKLHELRSRQIQPFYAQRATRSGDSLRQKIQWVRINRVISECLREIRSKESAVNPVAQTTWELSPFYKAKLTLCEMWRKRYFDKVACLQPPYQFKFASYFLHVQPEYSVDGLAFEYRDQLTVIENIAAFLPADWLFVVKEHKPMVGLRDMVFYKRLLKIPNVVLLSDSVNSYDLIKRSQIVFTLTGTASLEAMYEGVPSIILGNIYFDCFEGMYKACSFLDLKRNVSSILTKPNPGASENAAITTLAAMYAASYPGKIGAAYSMEEMGEEKNIKLLADAVEQALSAPASSIDSGFTIADYEYYRR